MALTWKYKIGGTGSLLTRDEVDNNILCIYGKMHSYGFTDKAIAGMCGCFYEESGMNPGIYETSHGGDLSKPPYFPGGMGLAQWTDYPAYTGTYPNPLWWSAQKENKNWWDGSFQCWLLTKCNDANYTSMGFGQGSRWGWQVSSAYPSISFEDYKKFSGSVEEAVKYWFYCLEWHSSGIPDWVNIDNRIKWGVYAFDLIGGKDPVPPEGSDPDDGELENAYYLFAVLSKRQRRLRNKYGK